MIRKYSKEIVGLKNLLPLPPNALETSSLLTAVGALAPCLATFSPLVSKRTFQRSPAYLRCPLGIATRGSNAADVAGEVEVEDPKDTQVPTVGGGNLCCRLAFFVRNYSAWST